MTKEQREKRLEFSQHSVGQTSCPSSGDLKKNRKVVTIQIETWEEAAPPRGGGGYCHIWGIWVCAAVKGMVFKQFTLG